MKHHFYTALMAFTITSGMALMAQPSFAQTLSGAPAGGGSSAGTTTTGTGTGTHHGHNKNGQGGAGGEQNGEHKGRGHEACERILAACEQHGFIKGQWKKDNGLYKDCFDPIVNGGGITQDGKTVSVPVSQSDAQACREAKEHHQENGQGQGQEQGQGKHQHSGQTTTPAAPTTPAG